MQRVFSHRITTIAALLASLTLAACGGADDATSAQAQADARAAQQSAEAFTRQQLAQSAQAQSAGPLSHALVPGAKGSADTNVAAVLPATGLPAGALPNVPGIADMPASGAIASAVQSLAADNTQVAPVMRYAPGDGGSNQPD